MTAEQQLTNGQALLVGARAEHRRRLARLLALGLVCDPWEQAGILARIRELLGSEGPPDGA
jgi:hypothetical protein